MAQFILTARDRKFLNFLSCYELMTTNQISDHFFTGIDKRTVLRRLRKLEHEKYIRRTHGMKSGEHVWHLSKFGAHSIFKEKAFIENINRNSLDHDVTLSEIRLEFEKMGIATQWTTEQSLRRSMPPSRVGYASREIIPDAIFAVRFAQGYEAVALELEVSAKNPKRYEQIFQSYGQKKSFHHLWYIVIDPSFGRRLNKQWNEIHRSLERPKFGFILLSDILETKSSLWLNRNGNKQDLKSLITNPNIVTKNAAHTPAHSVGM